MFKKGDKVRIEGTKSILTITEQFSLNKNYWEVKERVCAIHHSKLIKISKNEDKD